MSRFHKIVLINPPSPWLIRDTDMPPLGILYLAASLRAHGVSVEVCDLAGRPAGWIIPDGDLYGIGFTTPQYPIVKQIVAMLQRRQQSVVLGGPHASALPVRTLREMDVDCVFRGEADWSLADFVLGRRLDDIPGLYWRDGGEVRVNGAFPRVAVDLLPMPARDLIDIDLYDRVDTYAYVGGKREGHIITGRGCPHDCAFCAQRTVTGGRWRPRSVGSVVAEVEMLRDRYGCDQILFPDDTFNVDAARVRALAKALKHSRVTWHCLCRADGMTRELAEQMHDSGCRNVIFGFETGSDAILRAMGKHTTVAQNLEAARICRAAGMAVRAQMIAGFPGETDETIEETVEFVRTAEVDKWGFHAFVPLPGSDVWNRPETYGLALDRDAVDFSTGFTTIGRPGEWCGHPEQTQEWISLLSEIAKGKNAYEGMGQ